ncbi:MAG: 3-keto-disaccharide hydrolase [Candidatus Binatia bacterium]
MSKQRFLTLFDGRDETRKKWRKTGPNEFVLSGNEIITQGGDDFAVLYYAAATFSDFLLSLEFRLSDPAKDNSGVFVRFRNPELPPTPEIWARDEFGNISRNRAWTAAYSGFEIQIDERAKGSNQKKERDGLKKNRTGAIYKIPTGEEGEPKLQEYSSAPALRAGDWNEYAIEVKDHTYTVRLNGHRTTTFVNYDPERGLPASADSASGYIGLQSYRNSRVGFRDIRVCPL